MVTIQLITFKGCQSTVEYRNLLEPALKEAGLEAEVRMVVVPSPERAAEYRLHGSPTIRVDGREYQEERQGPAGFY